MSGHDIANLAAAWALNRETGAMPINRDLAATLERLRRALIQIELTDGPAIRSRADLESAVLFRLTDEEWERISPELEDLDEAAGLGV
jgi:hypothetical protein